MPKIHPGYYMGVDPGQSGGMACVSSCRSQGTASAFPMPPTECDVLQYFKDMTQSIIRFCAIEKVWGMPTDGPGKAFKFGMGYGGLRMSLIACGIPFDEVTPHTWQKGLGIPHRKKTESKTQWKNRLKSKAQNLFPKVDVTLATADALLIAEFCRRREEGLL